MATLTDSLETGLKQDAKDVMSVSAPLTLHSDTIQPCLPSESVYLTFCALVLRGEGSAENTQMNCCSPGSDSLIWPLLVHGGVGVMINKGNTVSLPSVLTMPPLAAPPSFRSACSGFISPHDSNSIVITFSHIKNPEACTSKAVGSDAHPTPSSPLCSSILLISCSCMRVGPGTRAINHNR